jgi:hypothetical protein
MKRLLFAALLAVTSTFTAKAEVSVTIGQPGFSGVIDISGYPQPQLIFPQPVIIEPVPIPSAPVYLRVPPDHAKDWANHCRQYNVCNEQVYFVKDDWYEREYIPRYQKHYGQPDFYGPIDINGYPQPRFIFPQPIINDPVPISNAPVYLRVPPGHAKDWGKHCRHYNACGQPAYFLADDWYNREYVPRYQEQHGRHLDTVKHEYVNKPVSAPKYNKKYQRKNKNKYKQRKYKYNKDYKGNKGSHGNRSKHGNKGSKGNKGGHGKGH